ncbi:MAG: heme-binding domain-containing protein [Cytophagales bacterium]|nr:heme-binding domain-containing protein [Cytophagales bacterium]
MKRWQYILGSIGLVFVVIQFIPNELPPTSKENAGDINTTGLINTEIGALLKTSCYSCHSNETHYPWYSYVAPTSWLMKKDVSEGREELNFSTWLDYDTTKMLGKLDDISSEVGEGRMPMKIYTLMHPSAKLDETQRASIVAWAEETMDKIAEEEEEEEVEASDN